MWVFLLEITQSDDDMWRGSNPREARAHHAALLLHRTFRDIEMPQSKSSSDAHRKKLQRLCKAILAQNSCPNHVGAVCTLTQIHSDKCLKTNINAQFSAVTLQALYSLNASWWGLSAAFCNFNAAAGTLPSLT